MAVTQTDQGTSLKLVARTLLRSGRRVGISQLTTTLKQCMGELGPEPEDALYNRLTLAMNDKATRLSLVQPGRFLMVGLSWSSSVVSAPATSLT